MELSNLIYKEDLNNGATGPTGLTGEDGTADTIEIGTTTTGDAGTNATVTDTAGSPNHILNFVIPKGFDGEDGAIGPTGPTGSTGSCECKCQSTGELIVNGGMENIADNKPLNWTFTNSDGVNSTTSQGRVHSGSWSVNINDSSAIEQTILVNNSECFYRLSFFARGEGSQVGLTVTIVFETTTGPVNGGIISIRQQDIINANREFAFYQLITSKSPSNTTGITVKFLVNAFDEQSLDLDDVSLTVI